MSQAYNKRKIVNDPVYGFVRIPSEMIFKIIGHRWFQRLRRIRQTGLTALVYPGANHTRFQHSIGAMYLMGQAIAALRLKDYKISVEEERAAQIAILLHDIGHGPFSHSLENSIVQGVSHEDISQIFMKRLNDLFRGELDMAIAIFTGTYSKRFLHQLVSSQLDMDRMDYLKRDSFFSGVAEGTINADRIISMLEIVHDDLAIESKGIYSVEKFIIARRLMYWQVYLHKAVIASEYLLVNVLKRARYLTMNGRELWGTPSLLYFLKNNCNKESFQNPEVLNMFSLLDDYDIISALKVWQDDEDKILSFLSNCIINRNLGAIEVRSEEFSEEEINNIRQRAMKVYSLTEDETDYIVCYDHTSNLAYDPSLGRINILYKDGKIEDISTASDQLNISVLSQPVTKYFLIYPKTLRGMD